MDRHQKQDRKQHQPQQDQQRQQTQQDEQPAGRTFRMKIGEWVPGININFLYILSQLQLFVLSICS
jgi:hypothetical protein